MDDWPEVKRQFHYGDTVDVYEYEIKATFCPVCAKKWSNSLVTMWATLCRGCRIVIHFGCATCNYFGEKVPEKTFCSLDCQAMAEMRDG